MHYGPVLGSGLFQFRHPEIVPRFPGKGLGSRLLAGALDDVDGVVTCRFAAAYLGPHPEYADPVVDT